MREISGAHWGMHLLEIEITYRCNLDCLHCYNRTEKITDMPLADIISLIETANSGIVQKLIITGGEACLHPDFQALCAYLKENRQRLDGIGSIVLQSNGHVANCSVDILATFDIVHLSFDYTGNSIRKIDAQQQVEFAKALQRMGIYSYFFTTLSKNNIDHMDELVAMANANGIPIAFNICSSNNRDDDYLFHKHEMVDVFHKLFRFQSEGKIRPFKHPYTAVLRDNSSDFYIGNRAGCTAGIASCVIKADGTVIPCPFLRVDCGNIYEDQLESIWSQNENLMKIRNRAEYKGCGKCKYISFCGGCRKSAFDSSGDLQGFDKGCLLSTR